MAFIVSMVISFVAIYYVVSIEESKSQKLIIGMACCSIFDLVLVFFQVNTNIAIETGILVGLFYPAVLTDMRERKIYKRNAVMFYLSLPLFVILDISFHVAVTDKVIATAITFLICLLIYEMKRFGTTVMGKADIPIITVMSYVFCCNNLINGNLYIMFIANLIASLIYIKRLITKNKDRQGAFAPCIFAAYILFVLVSASKGVYLYD